MFRTAMPDFHFELEDLIAEGDRVVWRIMASGTQHGELLGIPPTGRHAVVQAIVIARFESGLWAEDWTTFDQFGLLQQLGVIPAPQPVGV